MGKKLLSLEKIKIAKLTNLIKIKGGFLLPPTSTSIFTYHINRGGQSTKTMPLGYTSLCM